MITLIIYVCLTFINKWEHRIYIPVVLQVKVKGIKQAAPTDAIALVH